MTTKIQNIAMFAIAAFALIGMLGVPASALVGTTQTVTNTADGTTQTSSPTWNSVSCTGGSDTCQQKTKVYNDNPSDKVKVYYNVIGSTCDIKVMWFGDDGELDHTWNRSNYSGSGASVSNYMPISSTDNITTVVQYSNCS